MITNYTLRKGDTTLSPIHGQSGEIPLRGISLPSSTNWWKIFVLSIIALLSFNSNAQTVLINPTTVGGFENGSTFAANGWTVVNGSTDGWAVGNAPASATGANCAYVSTDSGTTWAYSQISTFTHLYRDVTIPAGETKFTLSFKWKAQGEGTTTSDWDNMKVWFAPTTFTPTATAAITSTNASQVAGPGAISGMYKLNSASWNSETITVVGTAGVTYRLIFSWKSDSSDIANPPIALDDISFSTQAPGTFTSVATGNWNAPATWDAGSVPTFVDQAIITAGHTVSVNATSLAINDLTVNGTLDYTATPTTFAVNGNLNVAAGGLVNVFSGTTGKTLSVVGNITNNGVIDASVGTTTAGNLTLAGTTIQTVSGTGNFGTNNVIRNLTFANTNAVAASNIVWQINDVKIANNLSMTGARVNLGTNKMTFGYNAAGGTLTAPVGTGFTSGKFSRYWSATATGSAITAGTDPTNATSRYPFLSPTGLNRAMYITRTNATGAVAGELAVTYNDASGSTPVSIVDGAYTVTDRYNGSWSVSNEGTAVSASSYTVVLFANSGLAALNGNSRVTAATTAISGTHQNGTATPGAQRIAVTQADLLAGPLYVGIGNADLAFASVGSGNWNQASTWNKGAVPACTDVVSVENGHTVTSNSAGNVAKTVTINGGGTLVQASGDLTVGCTLKNNQLLNNGTLTVSGGTLNVNGNINNAIATSTFNQSGGTINIDGNDAGVVANSVASATPLLNFLTTNINLTGGTLLFVDPHASTTSNTTAGLAVNYSSATSALPPLLSSPSHTTQFGDGISTDAGGNVNGFRINAWAATGFMSFGKMIVNGGSTSNRAVTGAYQVGATGDVNVNAGSTLSLTSGLVFGGNLNVMTGATYVNTGVSAALVASSTSSNLSFAIVSTPQAITNSGTLANSATTVTANLTSLQVANSSANGVTLNSPVSISGTLTLSIGLITTTDTNLLTLGTATAAGTLTGGTATSYINGPFARSFAIRASAATYDQTTLFPVGKGGEYLPLNLAPTTTVAGVKLQAEAFDTNTGTTATANVLGKKRWEVDVLAGSASLTNVFVKETAASILATDVIAQAPAASGLYTTTVPTTSAVGSLTSTGAIATADFTGFLSFSHPCVAPAEPTGTATQVFCNAATVADLTATVTTGNTYVWYDAATAGNLLAGTVALTNGGTYFAAQISEGVCESATRFMVTATITPLVTPNFAAIAPICAGSTAPVLGTTSPNGVTGTWSPATVSNTANGTYVFTPTAGSCANTQTLSVTVTPVVTPNFAAIAPICAGSTAPVLATTSPNGVTGTWSPATVSNTANGTYVFTPTAGLCANTQTLSVTVTPLVTPNFAAIAPICAGSTAPVLGTTSPNGVTGTWSPATVSNTANGTYVFTPTAGLCANTQTLSVTVTPVVTPNFAAIAPICSGSTAPVLGTTSPNGVTGTWSPTTVSNTANGTYVFTPTAGLCANTQTLSVTVNASPAQPTGAAVQYGATLGNLVVSPTTGILWYGNAGDAVSGNSPLALTTPTVDNATYYAVLVSGTCRSTALAVTIDFDLSAPSFAVNQLKYYPNPVNDVLKVSYSENISELKLYNLVGQQVLTQKVNANETQIDMSNLPSGTYMLEVSSGSNSKIVKLIKK